MDDRLFCQMVLGLAEPWAVESVELRPDQQAVRVRVATRPGSRLTCPGCGSEASRYDLAEERRWRHLDTMQGRTISLPTYLG